MTNVCGCSRPAGDAYVCRTCIDELTRDLRNVVDYLAEALDDAIAKQTAFPETGTRPQPFQALHPDDQPTLGAGERPLPLDLVASDAGWALHNTLAAWTAAVMQQRAAPRAADAVTSIPQGGETHVHGPAILGASVTILAAYLTGYAAHIRQLVDGYAAVSEISYAVEVVRRAIDIPTHRTVVEVGPCPELDCTGQVRAYIPAHPDRAAHMACTSCRQRWEPWQWHRAGRRILARKASA